MDVVLSVPVFLAVALVAVVGVVLLGRTWLFWLPGVVLAGYGIVLYLAWPWYDTHEDIGGLEGLSNLLHVVSTVVVVAGGIVCVVLGLRARRRARRAAHAESARSR